MAEQVPNTTVGTETTTFATLTPYATIGDQVFVTKQDYDNMMAGVRKSSEERALKSYKLDDDEGKKTSASEIQKQMYDKAMRDLEPLVRKRLEQEANMSAQELFEKRMAEEKEAMKMERIEINRDACQLILQQNNFDEMDIKSILDRNVDEDLNASKGRVFGYVDMFKKREASIEERIKRELYAQNPAVRTGISNANDIQSQYDNAKKAGKTAVMMSLIREAKNSGIDLKQ